MEQLVTVIGWIGTVALVGAYGLLTARRLTAGGWIYQTMNLIGGLGLMINSGYHSAWPSAALNLVWLGIGTAGLIHGRRRRRPGSPDPESA